MIGAKGFNDWGKRIDPTCRQIRQTYKKIIKVLMGWGEMNFHVNFFWYNGVYGAYGGEKTKSKFNLIPAFRLILNFPQTFIDELFSFIKKVNKKYYILFNWD